MLWPRKMTFAAVVSLLIGSAAICCTTIFSSLTKGKLGWKDVRLEHVSESILISRASMCAIRLTIAIFELGFIIHRASLNGAGIAHGHQVCNPGGGCVPFEGRYIFATFTVWCWTAQGIYFLMAGLSGLFWEQLASFRFMHFALWVSYQVMFAMSLLVFSVVWFVLVPAMEVTHRFGLEEAGQGLEIFYSKFGFVTHVLNLVFMLVELSFNRLPFKHEHAPFGVLWGILYASFAILFHEQTGVWFYFFLDYRPMVAFVPYLMILAVISHALPLTRTV